MVSTLEKELKNAPIVDVYLLCGTQDMGPHIFQTCPSANYFDCKAMSIGARSQSARTYLERCMEKFLDCKIHFLFLGFVHTHIPTSCQIQRKNIRFTPSL